MNIAGSLAAELMKTHWAKELIEAVSECWEWHAPALRIGFSCRNPKRKGDCRKIWIYPPVQEIVGGPLDGRTIWSGFDLDVSRLLTRLKATHIRVSTRTPHNPPALIVWGMFQGRELVIRFCLAPPDGAATTEVIDIIRPGQNGLRRKGR